MGDGEVTRHGNGEDPKTSYQTIAGRATRLRSLRLVTKSLLNRSARLFLQTLLLGGKVKASHVTVRVGYHDRLDVPESLRLCRMQGLLERNLDLEHASYFLSKIMITPTDAPPLRRWRKKLFVTMARNAASPIDAFRLPRERTVIVAAQVAL